MISAFWLIPAVLGGATIGVVLFALVAIQRNNDQ